MLNNRLSFDMTRRPPLLRIKPVRESDAGEYRCRVDYKKHRTKNFGAKLTVIGIYKTHINIY